MRPACARQVNSSTTLTGSPASSVANQSPSGAIRYLFGIGASLMLTGYSIADPEPSIEWGFSPGWLMAIGLLHGLSVGEPRLH